MRSWRLISITIFTLVTIGLLIVLGKELRGYFASPIGYVLVSGLNRSSEIAYNVFETYRGGESSRIYGRVLACVRHLFGADAFASLFGVPPASPSIFSDLNALFLMAVGTGYYFPWRDPAQHRGYMWIMGPLLKGAGAIVFVLDYFYRGSPVSFLLFAASDGALAMLTLWALLTSPGTRR